MVNPNFVAQRYPMPYDTGAQHHCSHTCLYFWCFPEAIRYFWRDRKYSPDAAMHWGDQAKTQAVIRQFLASYPPNHAKLLPEDEVFWASKLAYAWWIDENRPDWPPWVSTSLRQPPPCGAVAPGVAALAAAKAPAKVKPQGGAKQQDCVARG